MFVRRRYSGHKEEYATCFVLRLYQKKIGTVQLLGGGEEEEEDGEERGCDVVHINTLLNLVKPLLLASISIFIFW